MLILCRDTDAFALDELQRGESSAASECQQDVNQSGVAFNLLNIQNICPMKTLLTFFVRLLYAIQPSRH